MKYTIEKKDYSGTVSNVKEYDFAVLYKYSECKICKADSITADDWAECMEARLFNENAELHLFPSEGFGILTKDLPDGLSEADKGNVKEAVRIERTYKLNANKEKWKNMVIYLYLEQDDEGQNQIVLTRLAKFV